MYDHFLKVVDRKFSNKLAMLGQERLRTTALNHTETLFI